MIGALSKEAFVDQTLHTLDGRELALADDVVAGLESRLDGTVIRSGEPGYDEARSVWNGMIDRRPALIVRCAGTPDVVAAVRFAREHELLVAVRGGGHNVAGHAVSDGAIVVDLSQLGDVEVDAERRLVRAGGGCRLGDVDGATQEHGLAVPFGVVSQTGIAGLTLGGGMGWLRRAHGLTSTTSSRPRSSPPTERRPTASADEHPDLFWALRGGGGNFGVVTSFEYRLHPVGPEVAVAFVLYPGERAVEVIDAFAAYMAEAPEEVSPLAFLGRVPHAEAFPEEAHGRLYVALAGVHPGPVAEGERCCAAARARRSDRRPQRGDAVRGCAVAPRRGLPRRRAVLLEVARARGARPGRRASARRARGRSPVRSLDDRHLVARRRDGTRPGGGDGVRRTADDPARYEANFEDPADAAENVAWVPGSLAELQPFSTGGAYLNFPGFFEEGDDLLRASFGEANYERLVRGEDGVRPGQRLPLQREHPARPVALEPQGRARRARRTVPFRTVSATRSDGRDRRVPRPGRCASRPSRHASALRQAPGPERPPAGRARRPHDQPSHVLL